MLFSKNNVLYRVTSMKLLQNVKNYCGILTVSALLCSCSSAVFPDIIEEDNAADSPVMSEDSSFVGRKSKKIELAMPEEGSSLRADEQNVAYDDEDKELDAAMNSDMVKDEVTPAKTKPIQKAEIKKAEPVEMPQSTDLSEEETIVEPTAVTEDDGTPSVSYRMDTFYFNNGSAVLDSQYNKQIRNIAKLAKSKKNAVVKVLGFASSRTRNTDVVSHKLANFKISAERAASVANALKRYGLPASQIETEALSDSAPAYQEVMPEGERLNRRVEVYITY